MKCYNGDNFPQFLWECIKYFDGEILLHIFHGIQRGLAMHLHNMKVALYAGADLCGIELNPKESTPPPLK